MQILNENNVEVTVDQIAIEFAKDRRVFDHWKMAPIEYVGLGPKQKICLLLCDNGMGDYIHAMPGIWQKIQDGYDVTVYGPEFYKRCWESVGAKHLTSPLKSEERTGFIDIHIKEFGIFFSLKNWCVKHDELTFGAPFMDRFHQFAELIGTCVPKAFDWRKFLLEGLEPDKRGIVLGLTSSNNQRAYPYRDALRSMLNDLQYPFYELEGWMKDRKEGVSSFEGILSIIEGASTVISVDSGPLAVALALKKKTIAIMGPTDEQIIVHQFSRI